MAAGCSDRLALGSALAIGKWPAASLAEDSAVIVGASLTCASALKFESTGAYHFSVLRISYL